jgi:oligosaccharide repeat unit polymerase
VVNALLIVPVLTALAGLVHRLVHGKRVGMTPLAGYSAAWITVFTLYLIDPLGLDQVSTYAWMLIGISSLALVLGYGCAIALAPKRSKWLRIDAGDDPATNLATADPLKLLWLACLVAGSALFVLYVNQLVSLYGLSVNTLQAFRINEGLGPVPIGFYFYIFAEPLVPISVVLWLIRSKRRSGYLLTAAFATVALLATTGRTNALYAVLWSLSAYALFQGSRLVRPRQLLVAATSLLLAFAIFQVLGENIGKTYEHSALFGRFGDQPPIPAPLVVPYLYLEGPLPTFSAVVRDTDSYGAGRYSFRPVYQFIAFFDHDITVPPHIQDFEAIPYPFNASTYLSSFYRDFGIVGVLFGPAVVGLIVGILYAGWRSRASPATLCLAAFACVVTISSVYDLPLLDLSRVVEVGALAIAAILEGHRSASQAMAMKSQ